MNLHKFIIRFFGALSSYSIRHPKRVLVMAIVLTLVVAPGFLRLRLRTDGHALVAQNAPEVIYDRSIRDTFGIEDWIVVLIQSKDSNGVFNPATLQLVRELTSRFAGIQGINPSNVVSLATEHSFRARPGTMYNRTFLETAMNTREECEQLRDDLRRINLYTGTLVSFDGKTTAILIGTPMGADRTVIYRAVGQVIERKKPVSEEISITGAPVAEALLGIHILEDLGVPKLLLGVSMRGQSEVIPWKFPANGYELRRIISQRIGLVPIALLVMAAVFYLSFRSTVATVLPLAEVGACLMFVFGLMGWLGVPVYLTIAVMPVLLTAMGVTEEIHVFHRYLAHLRERSGVREAVAKTMDELCVPLVNTSLTTAIGFLAFAFSPLEPVRAFGIFTAIGVVFCLLWSLTVTPAMLALINPALWLKRARKSAEVIPETSRFGRLAMLVVRKRNLVVGVVLLIVALTPFGLRRLIIQDSWIDGFDPAGEFSRATRLVNEQFRGMHLLYLVIDAGRVWEGELAQSDISYSQFSFPGELVADPKELVGHQIMITIQQKPNPGTTTNVAPRSYWRSVIESAVRQNGNIVARTSAKDANASIWLDVPKAQTIHFEIGSQPYLQPSTLHHVAGLAEFVRQRRQYAVGGVLSAADYVATTSFMIRPNDEKARRIPAEPIMVRTMWDYYRIVRGERRLHEVVDAHYARSLTAVFLREANFVDTARLMEAIRGYEREHLAPQGINVRFAGDVAVSQSLIKSIVTTQLQSLFGSLIGILALTSLLGRSLRWGIYCIIPSTLAVVINFAVMGWMKIPLGVATSMFAGMTLGIGVDFATYVLEGFTLARTEGRTPLQALAAAIGRTGPPVLINTLAVALGFGVLLFSQVPANSRLGLLVVLGLVNCFIASMLLLPVLLHWWPLRGVNAEAPVASNATPQTFSRTL